MSDGGAKNPQTRLAFLNRFDYFDNIFGVNGRDMVNDKIAQDYLKAQIEKANIEFTMVSGRAASLAIGNTVFILNDDEK